MEPQLCPFCHASLLPTFFFCPNCGKKIKSPPLSTSFSKQLGVYALSIFLPPLGLFPAIKYLKQPDDTSKIVGIVTIALTILSFIVTIFVTLDFVNQFNKSLNSQLNTYQNYGL